MKNKLEKLEEGYPQWANTEFRKTAYANLLTIFGGAFALPSCLRKTNNVLKQEERACLKKTGRQPDYATMNDIYGESIHNPEYEGVARFATLTGPPFISALVFGSWFVIGAKEITGDYANGLYALLATHTASGIYEMGRHIKRKLKKE